MGIFFAQKVFVFSRVDPCRALGVDIVAKTRANPGNSAGPESPVPKSQTFESIGLFATKKFSRISSRFEGWAKSDRRAGSSYAVATLIGALALAIASPPALAQASAPNPNVHRILVIPVNLHGRAPVAADRKQIVQALYGATE